MAQTDKRFIPLSVPNFGGNERAYVNDAVVSEWVSTGGSKVGEFEDAVAAYVGMPSAVACASGTAGLHLAMLAAGLGPADEVLAPALTFIAAVNPIRYTGATPVFIGCDDTLGIDPDEAELFLHTRCEERDNVFYNIESGRAVRALLAVHVFGNLARLERLAAVAAEHGLVLIEDATEALGSYFTAGPLAGRHAGTVGDVGVYSFNGNKIITTGSGGMLVSNRDGWAARAKHLSTQAKTDELRYLHDEVGYNYRMTNLQAALGLAQLEQLESFVTRKAEMYRRYRERLDGRAGLRLLPFRDDTRSNRWFYSLYIEDACPLDREGLMAALREDGIQTRPIWGLVNDQPPYAGCEAYGLNKARDYHARVLNLPCSTNLADDDVDRVCEAILARTR